MFALEHMKKKTMNDDNGNYENKTKELTVHALSSYSNSKASPTDVESAFALIAASNPERSSATENYGNQNGIQQFESAQLGF